MNLVTDPTSTGGKYLEEQKTQECQPAKHPARDRVEQAARVVKNDVGGTQQLRQGCGGWIRAPSYAEGDQKLRKGADYYDRVLSPRSR